MCVRTFKRPRGFFRDDPHYPARRNITISWTGMGILLIVALLAARLT